MLYEQASSQAGYFTTKQARAAGYSSQLLQFYLRERRVERWSRGIFRLVHFPPTDREDLVPIWLWSEQKGVPRSRGPASQRPVGRASFTVLRVVSSGLPLSLPRWCCGVFAADFALRNLTAAVDLTCDGW